MKILFFGTGRFYQRRKSVLERMHAADDVIGFVDNHATASGTFEGRRVYHPSELPSLAFDAVVLMSVSVVEMREQLLHLGIPSEKILFWGQYAERFVAETQQWLPKQRETEQPCTKGRILVVSGALGIGGGILASCYAAEVLAKRGYDVTLAAPSGTAELLASLRMASVNVWLLPGLSFLQWHRVEQSRNFDASIVCFFQNIHVAHELSLRMPVLWWVHEPCADYHPFYPVTRYCFPSLDTNSWMWRLRIAAVSKLAKNNFEEYYPEQADAVLPLGEPDTAQPICAWCPHKIVRFAVMGAVIENKGQDIFLQAALQMPEVLQNASEFLVVGHLDETADIYQRCKKLCSQLTQAHILGQKTPEEVAELLATVDVIVCSSLEETMSMPIIEGMMHGKICITTDNTGVADYIEDGRNGFVVEAGNVTALAQCMTQIHQQIDEMQSIRSAARATYETHFTMEAFGERLEAELQAAKRKWKAKG